METGGNTMDYSTMFDGVVTEVTSAVGSVVPAAIGILGTILAISVGIKVFKKLARG